MEVLSSPLHLNLSSTSSDEDDVDILEVSGSREHIWVRKHGSSSWSTKPLSSTLSVKAPDFKPRDKVSPHPKEFVSKGLQTSDEVLKFGCLEVSWLVHGCFSVAFSFLSICILANFTNPQDTPVSFAAYPSDVWSFSTVPSVPAFSQTVPWSFPLAPTAPPSSTYPAPQVTGSDYLPMSQVNDISACFLHDDLPDHISHLPVEKLNSRCSEYLSQPDVGVKKSTLFPHPPPTPKTNKTPSPNIVPQRRRMQSVSSFSTALKVSSSKETFSSLRPSNHSTKPVPPTTSFSTLPHPRKTPGHHKLLSSQWRRPCLDSLAPSHTSGPQEGKPRMVRTATGGMAKLEAPPDSPLLVREREEGLVPCILSQPPGLWRWR